MEKLALAEIEKVVRIQKALKKWLESKRNKAEEEEELMILASSQRLPKERIIVDRGDITDGPSESPSKVTSTKQESRLNKQLDPFMLLDYKAVGVELILPAAKVVKEELPKISSISRNNPHASSTKSLKSTGNAVS